MNALLPPAIGRQRKRVALEDETRRVAARRVAGSVCVAADTPGYKSPPILRQERPRLEFATLSAITGDRVGTHFDAPCPVCATTHNAKKPVLRAWQVSPGLITFNCARCGTKGHAFKRALHRDFSEVELAELEQKAQRRRLREEQALFERQKRARLLWTESTDELEGTPACRYFVNHRGLNISGLWLGHVIRWHRRTHAIIAQMTDPVTGEFTGVHRTYLNEGGTKIERKMLGRKGVIKLSPDEDVTLGLGICEGIEDALALILSRDPWSPVWSACDKGGIASFPVLSGIEALTIFADGDALREAENCAHRWHQAGKEAVVVPPPRAS